MLVQKAIPILCILHNNCEEPLFFSSLFPCFSGLFYYKMNVEPGGFLSPISPGSGFVIHPMGGNSRPIWQSRAMAAREVHTLKVVGSIPASAPIASDWHFGFLL